MFSVKPLTKIARPIASRLPEKRNLQFSIQYARKVELITWYLEMLSPQQFSPKLLSRAGLIVQQLGIPCPEFSRFLYDSVGRDWAWWERRTWSYDRWRTYLSRPEVQTWIAYDAGIPAGYIELEAQPQNTVEIVYFGLRPQFIGQGMGGHLLSVGVQKAWDMGAQRVWVHTCSLDSPHALRNYQSRGFKLYDSQVSFETLPGHISEAWQIPR